MNKNKEIRYLLNKHHSLKFMKRNLKRNSKLNLIRLFHPYLNQILL